MGSQVVRIGEDGSRPKARDLTGGSKGLSGNAYVVGELDESHETADGRRVPGISRHAIPIRTTAHCEHGETVCTTCAESWMYDWVFYFARTAGGRRLRDELGGDAALEAMAARRDAYHAPILEARP